MAIQIRGGSYENFDPNKMLPREPSVITSGYPDTSDGTAVMMSFGAGKTKRMATYEEMEENMQKSAQEIISQEVGNTVDACKEAAQTATDAAEAANEATESANTAAENANAAAEKAQTFTELLNPSAYFGVSTETVDTETKRTVNIPELSNLTDGTVIIVVFMANINGYYPSLNVNNTGAKGIYTPTGTSLIPNVIIKNKPYILKYDLPKSRWLCMNLDM